MLQQHFSAMAGKVSHPVISKIRDVLSSILRAAVDAEYLNKNPMERLRLPLDKRPITPEQFANLMELVSEPYATMIITAVWTGLRVSELIGLKWRCLKTDAIEERYCRGDWSKPTTEASARHHRGGAGSHRPPASPAHSHCKGSRGAGHPKTQTGQGGGPGRSGISERTNGCSDERSERAQAAHQAGGPEARIAVRQLAVLAHFAFDLAGAGGSRPEIGARSNAALAHFDHNEYLRADCAGITVPGGAEALGICPARNDRSGTRDCFDGSGFFGARRSRKIKV
jgi:hypothetical protein